MDVTATRGLLLRSRTGAPYRFDAGALCLELLTTGGPGPYERWEVLHAPADLAGWAASSRLEPTPELEISAAEVADARRLRDALWRAATALTRGEPAAAADLAAVNGAAARPPLSPAVAPDGGSHWTYGDGGRATGTALLATVAHDAVGLLTGPFAGRIRTCAAADCELVYVDTSRPGRRRWCAMEHCGNLHKVRTLRARRTDGAGGAGGAGRAGETGGFGGPHATGTPAPTRERADGAPAGPVRPGETAAKERADGGPSYPAE